MYIRERKKNKGFSFIFFFTLDCGDLHELAYKPVTRRSVWSFYFYISAKLWHATQFKSRLQPLYIINHIISLSCTTFALGTRVKVISCRKAVLIESKLRLAPDDVVSAQPIREKHNGSWILIYSNLGLFPLLCLSVLLQFCRFWAERSVCLTV